MTAYLDIFTAKRDLCRALLDLSTRQAPLIATDDYSALLAVLQRKQTLLGELDTLKSQHAGALTRWRNERDGLPPAVRRACEDVLAETETLVAELVREEQSSTESLVARRDETRIELGSVATGATVNDAYRDNLALSTHRHLDLDT